MNKIISYQKLVVDRLGIISTIITLLIIPSDLLAQNSEINIPKGWEKDPPEIASLVDFTRSESNLRVAIIRYIEDKKSINRRYEVLLSPVLSLIHISEPTRPY